MPETGELIGPYRVISPLGKGAMGEVWRARDERLDRYVALKVLPAEVAGDVERRARMLREARAAAAIRHGNVVTLFDVLAHRGDDILVMELVDGKTLAETLRSEGAPSLEVGLAWIAGVADALVAAHGRGILHRDIKAANIMVDAAGGVKVLDFGLAKLRGDEVAPEPAAPPVRASAAAAARAGDGSLDATVPGVVEPSAGASDASMAKTLASPVAVAGSGGGATPSEVSDLASYRTHAGQLLGTPLYMAPEQLRGAPPDERSEVYSLGVLAHEILAGKPPYAAGKLDALFEQITTQPPPPIPGAPAALEAILVRALAKDPAARWPSMAALRDALAAERRRLFAPRARRWPIAVAAAAIAVAAAGGAWWWRANRTAPEQPGDAYVARALEEYDVFYTDKALSSLRAALAVAPEHPRANAYLILVGGAGSDAADAIAAAQRARPHTDEHSKDRALLDAALALAQDGPAAARAALVAAGADTDRELAFWAAELDYRAGHYAEARAQYDALLAEPAPLFRGRIYDHDSSVLLYFDQPAEALRIGKLYRDALPGEADAVGVYATTLAAAGKLPEAVAAAEDALRLSEGEDTLAGLAKVLAVTGDHARAKDLYQRALDKAGSSRRPLRRAALGFLQWIDGDVDAARATVAPCLAGGADSAARERGPCLFVAGVVDPARAEPIAAELDALAADASPLHPAYGAPAALAQLVRARAQFFGGGCVVDPTAPAYATPPAQPLLSADTPAYAAPLDFYAAYHVPFFFSWATCERAALLAAHGDRAAAAAALTPIATRAPGRAWLTRTLARYE
jgi:serine/threonine protein kinase